MKYIILKAQEAREFEDLSGLTITKQFKPAPPYIEGAVLEQTDGGNWRLVDATERPIGQEDGAADAYVPPVQSGDIVYICEPWIRLKNPDGSLREEGYSWRAIPHDFPKWKNVCYHYDVWAAPDENRDSVLDRILRRQVEV